MGFYARKEKVVAPADNRDPAVAGAFGHIYGIVGDSAVYIHVVLGGSRGGPMCPPC